MRTPPLARGICAGLALAALAIALGPLDRAADRGLTGHMVQHVLIGAVAPALLATAAPMRFLLARLRGRARRRLAAVLHGRAARILARPAVAVPVACAVLLAGHLPAVLDAALRHPLLHDAEHAALFWSALAAWMVVLRADPLPAAPGPIGMLAALSAWMVVMATVGSQFASADHVLIPAYAAHPGAIADQHHGGLIMWLGGLVTVAPVAVVGCMRAMWLEERRQRRRDELEAAR